eukprot:TRINITY_DN4297_c0_g1_i1.p2 TRINITY_DN4297_c0_g1~~TRINITY_DN4297_c0_g1_i1.p2  ORF type:complete len:134 (+),score=36.02 TRINITY_DN4297_c0_g1_i1:75-476(+)
MKMVIRETFQQKITVHVEIYLKEDQRSGPSQFESKPSLIQILPTMSATKVQKVMTQPINLIFRYLQTKARIAIWLYEQTDTKIEGRIIGFDEYMNLVLDEAEEVITKKDKETRQVLGRIMLKGDNITLMQRVG